MGDNLNFKAVPLSLFNNKTSKTNGFDTIEIDLVCVHFDFYGFHLGVIYLD